MQRRRIGALDVSEVGLGCNNFGMRIDAVQTERVVGAALDAGINFFDTAEQYARGQSEEFLGRALALRRSEAIVATKFGHPASGPESGGRPENVRKALEGSLRRLGTDYIDLYQMHRPDPNVPIAETLGALDELVKAGKLREIGSSNFAPGQIRQAAEAVPEGAARFVSVQNDYSLLRRQPESGALTECERRGVAFIPYFPLANGLLTGKYRKGQPVPEGTRIASMPPQNPLLTAQNLDLVERLVAFSESRGHTLLELAFSWLLSRPTVASVIAGATKPEQVHANASAANWTLSDADLREIDSIVPRPM
ncbi:MAG: Oxidoreductase [uncultured Gemmatimonadetes bacterium]|uniref:Oxidoreductase n=1 Tax=uncultured Gemmatimonadota bacterium TaxID=203437 RepID=A0A6J4KPR5_9BACT|nr:MAG: Oxidoreductase [uncultured Gemmatimonadota bacterium]